LREVPPARPGGATDPRLERQIRSLVFLPVRVGDLRGDQLKVILVKLNAVVAVNDAAARMYGAKRLA
jgi:hypothetical protein